MLLCTTVTKFLCMFLLLCYFLLTIDSFNDTILNVLANNFLNSFYHLQDQHASTETPTTIDDGDDNNDEPSTSIIVGSIASVLSLMLVLLIVLWFGRKFFSHIKCLVLTVASVYTCMHTYICYVVSMI